MIENTLLPVRAFGRVDAEDRASAEQLLGRVGLGERKDHLPGQLSGGERQRAAIARGLIMAPKVLLCDEPTGNLDGQTATQVTETMIETVVSADRALVVITHSDELANRMSRRLTLRDGQCFEV